MHGADVAQDLGLRLAAHDVDERDAVLEAYLLQHLAEIGGGGGVYQRGVAFTAHGLGHAKRGQRIDEAGRALRRRGASGQDQHVGRFQRAVLRVHRAADSRDGLAQQRLGVRARLDYLAGAFIAGGQRLADASGHGAAIGFWYRRRHFRVRAGAGEFRALHVGRTEQQADVGWIDRRRGDADHDLVRSRLGDGDLLKRQFEFAAVLDERAQLQAFHDVLPGCSGLSLSLKLGPSNRKETPWTSRTRSSW